MSKYFSPRLVLIHLIGLVLVVSCLALSNWQWSRAHVAKAPVNPLAEIDFEKLSKPKDFLPPSSVGQRTVVSGIWEQGIQVILPNRPADGRALVGRTSGSELKQKSSEPGAWVINFLDLSDQTSVAVVRGWTDGNLPAPLPKNKVTISGIVQPSEVAPYPKPIVASPLLTTEFLLTQTRSNLRDGFIIETPAPSKYTTVKPSRSAATQNSLRPLNVFYTGNWIFFALLLVAIWRRVVLDEVSDTTELNSSSKLET